MRTITLYENDTPQIEQYPSVRTICPGEGCREHHKKQKCRCGNGSVAAAFLWPDNEKALKSRAFGQNEKVGNFYQNYLPFMVEVRGVEPLSEDLSTRISPSAAAVQVFPFLLPRRRGNRSGSFIDPASRKALAGSFPILNDARICNDRSLQADALRYLSSNGKCVIVVFCI